MHEAMDNHDDESHQATQEAERAEHPSRFDEEDEAVIVATDGGEVKTTLATGESSPTTTTCATTAEHDSHAKNDDGDTDPACKKISSSPPQLNDCPCQSDDASTDEEDGIIIEVREKELAVAKEEEDDEVSPELTQGDADAAKIGEVSKDCGIFASDTGGGSAAAYLDRSSHAMEFQEELVVEETESSSLADKLGPLFVVPHQQSSSLESFTDSTDVPGAILERPTLVSEISLLSVGSTLLAAEGGAQTLPTDRTPADAAEAAAAADSKNLAIQTTITTHETERRAGVEGSVGVPAVEVPAEEEPETAVEEEKAAEPEAEPTEADEEEEAPVPAADQQQLTPEQLHEMGLSLFAAPSWRTKRRRQQSVMALATDLGQRLQQATLDLLETLQSHFAQETSRTSGLALPVTALAWLLLLVADDGGTDIDILRRLHLNSAVRQSLEQQLLPLLRERIHHLRVTHDSSTNTSSSSSSWPPVTTHRDQTWRPSFASHDASASSAEAREVEAADWLRAYAGWQSTPMLTSKLRSSLMPHLRVLWLDQVAFSSFGNNKGLLPALAPQLAVLRLERTSLESLQHCDIFQQQRDPTGEEELDSSDWNLVERDAADPLVSPPPANLPMTIFPQLTHLTITSCCLPSSFVVAETSEPIWRHFPALQSLTLTHNALGSSDNAWMVGLSLLTNLQRLDLSHNKPKSRRESSGLATIDDDNNDESSDTTSSQLSSVQQPARFSSLNPIHCHVGLLLELNCAHYGLTTCAGIDRLYALERLYLHHNALADLASVSGLAQLPLLETLTLYGNPLATTNTYVSQKPTKRKRLLEWRTRKQRNGTRQQLRPSASAYRLAVLDLFWQGRTAQQQNNGSIPIELPVLDRQRASPKELLTLRNNAFAAVVPVIPEEPNELLSSAASSICASSLSSEQPTAAGYYFNVAAEDESQHISTPQVDVSARSFAQRRRRRRVANIATSKKPPKRTDRDRNRFVPPRTKFGAAEVLQSLGPPMAPSPLPPPSPQEISESSSVSVENNDDHPMTVDQSAPVVPSLENEGSSRVGPEVEQSDEAAAGEGDQKADESRSESNTLGSEETPAKRTQDRIDNDSTAVLEEPGEKPSPKAASRGEASIDEGETLPVERDEKKVGTVRLLNDSFESGKVDIHKLAAGNDSVAGGGSSSHVANLSEVMSTENTTTSALHSAMLPSFVVEQGWGRGSSTGADDCMSVMSGSVAASSHAGDVDMRIYLLAEKKSTFTGPHTYKQITIHDNLEIYFRLFVFSGGSTVSSSLDPDELAWQTVLENYPRIQLRPVDRRFQEFEAASLAPTGAASPQEEYRRVWRERVIGCGKPSLKRLTPVRSARRGFHGDIVWPSSSPTSASYQTAAGVSKGKPDAVMGEQTAVLCASTAAFYIIADSQSISASPSSPSQRSQRSFPRPIPTDACFAEAIWPHALARHPWSHLRGITIGFNFQRITLHFQRRDAGGGGATPSGEAEEFCYILLTCNKLHTISLLKEFQDLTDNIAISIDAQSSGTRNSVPIENDDPIVLERLGAAVGGESTDNALGVVCHFQILKQYWKKVDRGKVRRLCVVTDNHLYLLDEDYSGDGSRVYETAPNRAGSWGEPRYCLVDEADLAQVDSVQAAEADPCSLTIVIRPSSRLYRTHNWRLVCRDREGAERLIDDVRKAVSLAAA